MSFLSSILPIIKAKATTNSDEISNATAHQITQQVSKTADIIDQYGVAITVLAIFLVVFVIILIYILNNNRKMMNNLMNRQLAQQPPQPDAEETKKIMKELFDEYATKEKATVGEAMREELEKDKEAHTKAIQINIDTYKLFRQESKEVLDEIHCQRVAIYLFHNGNSTPYGYPFAKITCAHDYTSHGTIGTIRGENQKSVPLYVFGDIIDRLVENKEYCIIDTNEEEYFGSHSEFTQLHRFIVGDEVTSLFALPIIDDNDIVAAFTIVEFKDRQEFSEEQLQDIRNALHDMNKAIRSIVISAEFLSKYSSKAQ